MARTRALSGRDLPHPMATQTMRGLRVRLVLLSTLAVMLNAVAVPAQPAAPQLVLQLRHGGSITARLSADGRFIVTGADDNTARVWDVETGRYVRELAAGGGEVSDVDISPDGHHALSVQGGLVLVWEVRTGKLLHQLVGEYRQTFIDRFLFGEYHRGLDPNPFRERFRSARFLAGGDAIVTASDLGVGFWQLSESSPYRREKLVVDRVDISDDRNFVVTTESLGGVSVLDVRTKGRISYIREAPGGSIGDAAISRNGATVVTGGTNGLAFFDARTATLLPPLVGTVGGDRHEWIDAVAWSPDGTAIASGSSNGVLLWRSGSDAPPKRLAQGRTVGVQFSSDGRLLLRTGKDIVDLWDVASGRRIQEFAGEALPRPDSVENSSDGRYLLAVGTTTLWRWDLSGATPPRNLEIRGGSILGARFYGSGSTCLVILPEASALYDFESGQLIRRMVRPPDADDQRDVFYTWALSPDHKLLLQGGGFDNRIWIWSTESGRVISELKGDMRDLRESRFAFSPSGSLVIGVRRLGGTSGEQVVVWDVRSGEETHRVESKGFIKQSGWQEDGTAFFIDEVGLHRWSLQSREDRVVLANAYYVTPDGRHAVVERFQVVDAVTGSRRLKASSDYYYTDSELSSDGRWLVVRHQGGATIWDVYAQRRKIQYVGPGNMRPVFLQGPERERRIAFFGDAGIHIVDFASGDLVATLFGGNGGAWLVAAPDGRFDTNNIDHLDAVTWVIESAPMTALPVEIFMRDYYEPRLLPRVLAGEKLPEIRPLAELNRVQPKVEIMGVERERDAQGRPGDTVAVTVQVAGASQAVGLEGQQRRMETGAYDLRLFRDGQLVDQWPLISSSATPVGVSADDELTHWRQERLVVELKDGPRRLVFKGIRLPRRVGVKDVQFSAYAFNVDRVKSETARRVFPIPADLRPRVPRAYLVTVGVNAFEDDRRDLSYAANDAQQLGGVLKGRLEAVRDDNGQPRYENVVWVKLTAEAHVDHEGTRQMTTIQARKAQIEAVLKTLAGQPVNAEALKGIKPAEQLRRANPEDLVIIALSTHGEVDQRGRFYLLPHDIGSNPTEHQRRTRSISNDELSEWLRGLDAIDLVMIVDACHSAASVQSQEFKPGPMGSRGLGQLAYDKGMRILTATQIDQYALETQKTQLGLLSYALVREGLEQHKADYKPQDEQIWLSEWLNYASERVPGLYQDWKDGTLKGRKKGEFLDAPEEHPGDSPALQQPALFDFARNRDALIGNGAQ